MIALLFAFATFASSAGPAQVAAADGLLNIPNTTIRYYDVTGRNVTEINRSIARQRPKGRDGKPIPASTDWAVRADFDRTTRDGQCRVATARASFKATVDLPRLSAEAKLDKPTAARWQNYVSQLEQGSLTTLTFVYQNLEAVEQAMLASSCETARAAGGAAIEKLRTHAARLDAEREKRLAQQNASLSEFPNTGLKPAQNVCRDLGATGSRIRSVRICMPQREWERMYASGEAVTREMQDKPRVNKAF